ncbi:MAG: hypothetical protein WC812_02515 [Candidatus Pacearchaeota archaeon]|jgi:hypothetical protein
MTNQSYQTIEANEKGYDEMTSFLGQSGFNLDRTSKNKNYWRKGDYVVKLISSKNKIELINVDDFTRKSLEYIAQQEKIRN